MTLWGLKNNLKRTTLREKLYDDLVCLERTALRETLNGDLVGLKRTAWRGQPEEDSPVREVVR